jgi:hypothetical protein
MEHHFGRFIDHFRPDHDSIVALNHGPAAPSIASVVVTPVGT